ncbi:MAG: ornithine cyclodeaminase family protein [Xanthomonadales bacterium]|nr:ornithine cyclodeaminase family protein [Xanthomonadales bacterium]
MSGSNSHPIRYLNRHHLDSLGLDPSRMVDALEEMFRLHHAGKTHMPPKIFFHLEKDRFYSAMASASPKLGFAASKWQSGDPANPDHGLPYIQGLLVLNEHEHGRMVAIMDAAWITGQRTAMASGLVARYQARQDSRVLCLLGCGVQGRAHLGALRREVPSLDRCRVFDIVPERQAGFIEEMGARFPDLELTGCRTAREAVDGADVIVTGGPITTRPEPTIEPDWIAGGALIVTIDYDSYVTDACIEAMDLVITDDIGQIEDARAREGKFRGVKRIDADLAALIAAGEGRRTDDAQRIMAFNLGIALEDLALARLLYQEAGNRDIGVLLER